MAETDLDRRRLLRGSLFGLPLLAVFATVIGSAPARADDDDDDDDDDRRRRRRRYWRERERERQYWRQRERERYYRRRRDYDDDD
ncbi:hypothetical protein [Bosea sp. NPDC055594]